VRSVRGICENGRKADGVAQNNGQALVIRTVRAADLSEHFELQYIARDKPIAASNWVEKIEEKCKLIATDAGIW